MELNKKEKAISSLPNDDLLFRSFALVRLFRKLIAAKEKEILRIPEYAYLPAINPPPCPLPIYEMKVQAGFPSPAGSNIAGMLDLNKYAGINPKKAFFVRAIGDAMNKIGIEKGDLLIWILQEKRRKVTS